mmetsp:Transcript_192/g.491  ORF Transcript_192/g.491 Transcript_192/m.491 type:complete len:92 (+) Transcript_192:1690-1965(+)
MAWQCSGLALQRVGFSGTFLQSRMKEVDAHFGPSIKTTPTLGSGMIIGSAKMVYADGKVFRATHTTGATNTTPATMGTSHTWNCGGIISKD